MPIYRVTIKNKYPNLICIDRDWDMVEELEAIFFSIKKNVLKAQNAHKFQNVSLNYKMCLVLILIQIHRTCNIDSDAQTCFRWLIGRNYKIQHTHTDTGVLQTWRLEWSPKVPLCPYWHFWCKIPEIWHFLNSFGTKKSVWHF